jgi:hypothetical protein
VLLWAGEILYRLTLLRAGMAHTPHSATLFAEIESWATKFNKIVDKKPAARSRSFKMSAWLADNSKTCASSFDELGSFLGVLGREIAAYNASAPARSLSDATPMDVDGGSSSSEDPYIAALGPIQVDMVDKFTKHKHLSNATGVVDKNRRKRLMSEYVARAKRAQKTPSF